MRTANFPRYLQIAVWLPLRVAAAIADRMARLNARIDAGAPPLRHRMGAWESAASFRAQALRDAFEKRAAGE